MWKDFESKEFIFEERDAIIVYPKSKPNGRILLKTEYLNSYTAFDVAMLEKGYHLIHIFHRTRWGSEEETDIMADFVRFCAKELGANEKCVLEGLSCGGLQATLFAEKYPELVSVMYLDSPVLNILSMAGLGECRHEAIEKEFWREIVATYGVNRSTIVNFRKSPIDNMEPLIKNDIPVIMFYGNADDVVIYEENGRVLEEYYTKNGGTIKVISRSMCGHNHQVNENSISMIVDFVEKYI